VKSGRLEFGAVTISRRATLIRSFRVRE
jgi:hypothetical protein